MALAVRFAAVVTVAALVAAGAAVRAQGDLEYQVKAAFLYNFLSFIEWGEAPPRSARPFRVCIIGADPFGRMLDDLVKGEHVGRRPIEVARPADEEAAASCQVVFVARSDDARLPTIVRMAAGKGVLIVGESARVLPACGAIAFVQDGERLRFDVNINAIRRQGLRASSKLLRVARDASSRYTQCDSQ
ncbi:MAG TPA: YfiR family protein [Vicinamibacterales bacterium]|nr:YfiR family protein [Vicinamibacterales bacterium]